MIKNILFYTHFAPSQNSGGVEHVTYDLVRMLSERGVSVYVLYKEGACDDEKFNGYYKIPEVSSAAYVKHLLDEKRIGLVVVQGKPEMMPFFRKVVDNNLKIIYVHHGDPGYGYTTFNKANISFYYKYGDATTKIKSVFKLLLFPFLRLKKKYELQCQYRRLLVLSDKILLISERGISSFLQYAGIQICNSIDYVNNPLSYIKPVDNTMLCSKKKEILFVGRLEEHTKKISLALDAWHIVSEQPAFSDWIFNIVGDGMDRLILENKVRKDKIKNVVFHGFQDPKSYYRTAAIFLMTSVSEGWGLTLTEAMQNGCVPIGFNSYPAIFDIINDGYDGFLVKYPNVEEYAAVMIDLIMDENKRSEMAKNALGINDKFKNITIADKWISLIKNL